MSTTARPFLMFQGQCAEALAFYEASVPDTRILALEHKPDGTVAMARLSVAGLEIMANDSPPVHDFTFTPSLSIFLEVDESEAVDTLAGTLGHDGAIMMPPGDYGFAPRFAWVQDRFDVSWQIMAR